MTRHFPQAAKANGKPATAHALTQLEERLMSAISDLQAQVAQTKAGEEAAAAAFQGIAAKVQAAIDNDDSAALQQLTNDLNASAGILAAAVVAVPGTPAAAAAATATPPPAAATPSDTPAPAAPVPPANTPPAQ